MLYHAFVAFLLITSAWTSDLKLPAPHIGRRSDALIIPQAQHCPKNKTASRPGLASSGGVDQTPLLYAAMKEHKRQYYCDSGYLQCNAWPDLCCEASGNCCLDWRRCVSTGQQCCSSLASQEACDVGEQCCINGCAPASATCCGNENYHCDAGYDCCDNGGCAPQGAQCCQQGLDGQPAYCNAGNSCFEATDLDQHPNGIQCCTDSACTAYVDDSGTTVTASSYVPSYTTSDYTYTYSYDTTVYWTFTYTWYYYAYFYTIYQAESTVTSTIDTTTTIFSVLATNEADASDAATQYVESVTAAGPPPEASTQLASEASGPSSSLPTPTGGSGEIEGALPEQTTTSRTTSRTAFSGTSGPGPQETVTVTPDGGSGAERGVVVGAVLAVGCFALAVGL